jgi:hypothetical protein
MFMFDDPKKELEELQEKLLQDEDWFEKELDSAKRMIGQVPEKDRAAAAAPKAKNKRAVREASAGKTAAAPVMDDTQVWSRELSFEQEEPKPKEKGIRNLLIIAALETLGIALVGAYWALFLLK